MKATASKGTSDSFISLFSHSLDHSVLYIQQLKYTTFLYLKAKTRVHNFCHLCGLRYGNSQHLLIQFSFNNLWFPGMPFQYIHIPLLKLLVFYLLFLCMLLHIATNHTRWFIIIQWNLCTDGGQDLRRPIIIYSNKCQLVQTALGMQKVSFSL